MIELDNFNNKKTEQSHMLFRNYVSFFVVAAILLLISFSHVAKAETAVQIPSFAEGALGKYTRFFQENSGRLSFEEARNYFNISRARKGTTNSISLGIDVDPVWMKININNSSDLEQLYRLSIETPWLDYIDTWLVQDGEVIRHVSGGDAYPFEQRPMQYRFYAFEHEFPQGKTELYIRIEAKGPMAIPVKFSSRQKAIDRDIANGYQYGILYGIMFALAMYNLVLFVFIKQREYGLYSLYLIGFVVNSLSYTGQLHTVITYDFGPYFQDWLDIFLMITYSVAGLHFARALLGTKEYAPSLDKFVTRTTILIPIGMLIGFIFDQLFFSMALAFILNTCFVVLFVAMGISALYANKPFALVFLFSSVTAAICITISTLAVAGFIVPYNDYTFKVIEVGMALEAILLATILARQFRMARLDKLIAETYAQTDTLTSLNNRRGFHAISQPIWQNIIRENRDASVILLDIDFFKKFNDQYGHETGDQVLVEVGNCIKSACRQGDVSARWGGEEFIILLPETSQKDALVQAERIRAEIEKLQVTICQVKLSITASVGVAGTAAGLFNEEALETHILEPMINLADRALYVVKQSGRNQVYAFD